MAFRDYFHPVQLALAGVLVACTAYLHNFYSSREREEKRGNEASLVDADINKRFGNVPIPSPSDSNFSGSRGKLSGIEK